MSVTAQVSLCLQVSLQKVHVDIGFRRETRERQTAVISVLRREHGGVEVCPVGMLKIRITDLRGGGPGGFRDYRLIGKQTLDRAKNNWRLLL